jgi:hypothetical protein
MARLPRIPDLLTTANLACGVGSILLGLPRTANMGMLAGVRRGVVRRVRWAGGPGPWVVVHPWEPSWTALADMVTFGVAPAFLCGAVALNLPDQHWHITPSPFAPMNLFEPFWV